MKPNCWEEEVSDHKTENDVEPSNIGNVTGMAHSFVGSHDKAFFLGNAHDDRHSE